MPMVGKLIAGVRGWRMPVAIALVCGTSGITLSQTTEPAELPGIGGIAASTIAALAILNMLGAATLIRMIRERRQTRGALNNMSQGLAMFDPTGRLVLFNARYAEMYELSAEWLRSRPMLNELLEQRIKIGQFKGDPM